MKADLDAIQARISEAEVAPGSTWGVHYITDVLALVAELRAARTDLDNVPALLCERDKLRGLLERHHEYIAGLTGEACHLCASEAVTR